MKVLYVLVFKGIIKKDSNYVDKLNWEGMRFVGGVVFFWYIDFIRGWWF